MTSMDRRTHKGILWIEDRRVFNGSKTSSLLWIVKLIRVLFYEYKTQKRGPHKGILRIQELLRVCYG